MQRILQLPLLVLLTGAGSLAMLLPAAHAAVFGDFAVRAAVFLRRDHVFLAVGCGRDCDLKLPARARGAQPAWRRLLGAYVWLPILFAVPFAEAVPDTSFANAWFEMVSSFTTTGATQYDTPGRLAPSLHLWRALGGLDGRLFRAAVGGGGSGPA